MPVPDRTEMDPDSRFIEIAEQEAIDSAAAARDEATPDLDALTAEQLPDISDLEKEQVRSFGRLFWEYQQLQKQARAARRAQEGLK